MKKLFFWALFFFAASLQADFSVPFEKHRLQNGLQVILIPRPESSMVTVQLFYRAGGVYEKNEHLGISHLLEHMMFKTTRNLKPGEYSYLIKSRGGYDNASTTYDYTTYYNVLPASELEIGLRLEAERMQNLTLVKEEFEKEREVVLEERHNRYENSPLGYLWEKASENFFRNHLYGRPVIGYEKTLQNITLEALRSYYNRYYNPGRAFLIVAGPIQTDKTLKLVKKYFSAIPTKEIEESFPARDFQPQKGYFVFKKEVKTTYGIIFTKIPDAESPLIPALILLDYILFNGQNSVINRELVLKKKLCYSVGGGTYIRKMPSNYIFQFIPAPGVSGHQIEKEWKTLLKSLLESDLKNWIRKARLSVLTDFYRNLETVKGIASTLGWGEILGSPDFLFRIYRKVKSLQEGNLKKAIAYLLENPSATYILEPGKESP